MRRPPNQELARGLRQLEIQRQNVSPRTPCRCGHLRHLHHQVYGRGRGRALICSRCQCNGFEEKR